MKVLLLNPKSDDQRIISRDHMGGFGFELKSTNLTPPLTLAYIAALLERDGFEVEIIDAVAVDWPPERVLRHIGQGAFSLIFVNTATPSIADDLKMIYSIKELMPDALICALGPHVTVFAEDTLSSSRTDVVIRGEAEYTALELARALERGEPYKDMPGLSCRWEDQVIHSPDRPWIEDLDALPFPARHLLPMDRYRSAVLGKRPFTTMLSSRGCPLKCTYCPYRVAHGQLWRARSPENVVEEVAEVVGRFGVKEILFRDPLFTFDKKRALDIAELIISRRLKVDWRCETRPDMMDTDLIAAFARAGCKEINFGIESASEKVLRSVQRQPASEEKLGEVFRECRRHGIETMAFFIIGLPEEDEQTIRQTLDLARRLEPDIVQFTAATPYPNTEYYLQLRAEELLEQDWSLFTSRAPVVGTRRLSAGQLADQIKSAYRAFYFRPRYLFRRLSRLRSPREVLRLWNGFKSVLRYSGLA